MVLAVKKKFKFFVLLSLLIINIDTKEVGDDYSIQPSDQEWLNSLFYLPTEPRVRKEYRMLSEEERYQFHDAFVKMKNDKSVIPNKYDLISSLHHRRSTRNSAHRGTGFLGWHRVYTLLMENALREWYPNMTMAYWDTTLDATLDLPRESCLWSEDFMGNGDGFVVTGVFQDWDVQTGRLYRTVGALYGPLTDHNISALMQFRHIGNISNPDDGKDIENIFEETHNRVHHFVGGEMKVIETAADDPIFFPYHSFISLVWEDFRALQRKDGIDPETDWDEYYGPARHHRYSPMGLGNLLAIDGSSNLFAENIVFADRPVCSRRSPDCGSPHLYCNVTLEKCSPWTIKEYQIIKKAGKDNKLPLKEAVIPFIETKISRGFSQLARLGYETEFAAYAKPYIEEEDLFLVMADQIVQVEPTLPDATRNPFLTLLEGVDYHTDVRGGGHGHEKGHGHFEGDDSNGEHPHNHEDQYSEGHTHEHSHSHGQVVIANQINYYETVSDSFLQYYAVYVLIALMLFRLVFTIVTKCLSENHNKAKRMYNMNGIANGGIKEENKVSTRPRSLRSDNVYTVTVTTRNLPSPDHNGTFVCFEKYTSNSPVVNIADSKCTNGRSPSTSSNYLDMTYASHSDSAKAVDPENQSDMYERNTDQDDMDDTDTTYNSIENENYDFVSTVDGPGVEGTSEAGTSVEGTSEAGTSVVGTSVAGTDGQKSEDSFDVFETYDNFVFKREAEGTPETGNTAVGVGSDIHYLPGTRL